eukprot:15361371-Ditylum_brightwellii.AAC.1
MLANLILRVQHCSVDTLNKYVLEPTRDQKARILAQNSLEQIQIGNPSYHRTNLTKVWTQIYVPSSLTKDPKAALEDLRFTDSKMQYSLCVYVGFNKRSDIYMHWNDKFNKNSSEIT